MEIASIKGDTVHLLYHPSDMVADVGQQFSILELPDRAEGLVVQIISNDSLEYAGLQQEMIQHILEQRINDVEHPIDREQGMDEIKSIKLATAKIRKRIHGGAWQAWDGWIPTRNVAITRIEAEDLIRTILPPARVAIRRFASFNDSPIEFDGPLFNMVNVITGVKGTGKSHLSKHLVIALSEHNIPCIIFDINGEYVGLPGAQVLRWGQNFKPNLAEVGYEVLETLIRTLYPLQPGTPSEAVFETRLPNIFNGRRQACGRNRFTIDMEFLRQQNWGGTGRGQEFVEGAIQRRLEIVEQLGLFSSITESGQRTESVITSLPEVYTRACNGQPIIFDMRSLGNSLQNTLVKSMIASIEQLCDNETRSGNCRYPFVFFEEAHFYVKDETIMNIITRGRHIGIASVFVTNTPQELPDAVFRQLDNLLLLGLTHDLDIKRVSKNSFTDEDTIQGFATRMPRNHALIIGNATDRYPLIVTIDDLPEGTPRSGQTKSTWDRFIRADSVAGNNQPST